MNKIIYILLLFPFPSLSQSFGGKIIYNKNRSISQITYLTNQKEYLSYYKNNNVKSQIFINSCGTENNWTGSINTAWENPANWSCNQVPNHNTTVVIKSGMPNNPTISTTEAKCKKLTIESSKLLNFNIGGKLTLYQ